MKKTVGVFAHVDAGKTTFSEQILYHTKTIRNRGRVDHKNTFLDNNSIEKDRGITIFSEQAIFNIGNSQYYLIDTPGHIDFSAEMERAIAVMDYAILIVSAVEGIQGHTETVWQLLRSNEIPTFIFINKIDREGANLNAIIQELNNKFSKNIKYIGSLDNLNDDFIEFIAEKDDELLSEYLDGNYIENLWIDKAKELLKENKFFPCLSGSALQDNGIDNFLQVLEILTLTNYEESNDFSGRVYKIRYDENGNKVTFIKALSGTLKVKELLAYRDKAEKINNLRLYSGNKFTVVDEVKAGDIFGAVGISEAKIGDGVGTLGDEFNYEMIPTLMSKVEFDEKYNIKDVLKVFKILEDEDPALGVVWNEKLQEIHINIMGKIQLEILRDIVLERFNIKVEFGPCKILYKETIASAVKGYGHFEPLRHYAEVHLKLEPNERGEGITFKNKCHADDLTVGNQNLIRTHIFEREHNGVLTGSALTDIKFTLLTGRAHNKHTEGGDFREATFRAIRQGLEKVESILLEPFYKFKIDVHLDYMGRVISDVQRLYGAFEEPKIIEDKVIIIGRGPVATFMDYSTEVIAFTRGKGSISLIFDGYDKCHNQDEIIENIGYNKNADIEYSSTSIFCSKGQGYIVPWDEAESKMHCEIID